MAATVTLGAHSARRPPAMSGSTHIDTIPHKNTGWRPCGYTIAEFPYRYPLRAALSKRQADVLELIRVKPRDLKEMADALSIGEWSIVGCAADQLVNRGLAELVPDAPIRPTWRATT